jgi:transposase
VPANIDLQAQDEFRDGTLKPLLDRAVLGKCQVYFVDAAHFVRGAFLGYLWCFVAFVVATAAGRQRYSVLGAVNAVSHQLLRVTTVATVTEVEVAKLFDQLRKAHPNEAIHVVLDNARYQHTKFVRAVAKIFDIQLVYLPTYSPNLNLIERVWKFVKKKALMNKHFADFRSFQNAINEVLQGLGTTFRPQMKTLLTHNFETLRKPSICTA